jgi:hypothetical protein
MNEDSQRIASPLSIGYELVCNGEILSRYEGQAALLHALGDAENLRNGLADIKIYRIERFCFWQM